MLSWFQSYAITLTSPHRTAIGCRLARARGKKIYVGVTFLLLLTVLTCNINKNLGGGYYIDTNLIVGDSGIAVPPRLHDYDYNDKYIIARTLDKNHYVRYWVVRKSDCSFNIIQEDFVDPLYWGWGSCCSNVDGPMNKDSFSTYIKIHDIKLKFRKKSTLLKIIP